MSSTSERHFTESQESPCGSFCPQFASQHPYYELLPEPTNSRRVFQTDSESHQLHFEFDFSQPIITQRAGFQRVVEGGLKVRLFHYVGFSPRKISVVGISILPFWGCRKLFPGDLILKVSLSSSRVNKVGWLRLLLIISSVFVCYFPRWSRMDLTEVCRSASVRAVSLMSRTHGFQQINCSV